MRFHASLTRRHFLSILGWLSTVGLTRPLMGSTGQEITIDPLIRNLTGFYYYRESARAIGRAYLQVRPAERDVSILAELICSPAADRRDELVAAGHRALREALLQQQRQDFAHGRTVSVKEWILSETEARLCALAALT